MNNLSDEDVNKINKLKQKLYSRSLTDDTSKLNSLHKHDLNIPKNWEKEIIKNKDSKDDKDSKSVKIKPEEEKESINDFLNNRFENNNNADFYSNKRADDIENKLDKTTATLKIAQAQLDAKNINSLYPNLKLNKTVENKNNFQPNYHANLKTVKIGETADMQDDIKLSKKKKNNFNFSLIIFIFVFIIFVGSFFYTYINILNGKNTISTNKIDIKVTGPVSVKSGEVSDFIIDITNNNNSELILSDLIIQYPSGSRSPFNKNQDLTNERISVGTIKPGETIRKKNSVVFFGEQNIKKNINYSYEFNINDSSTIFQTEKNVSVFIVGSPINIVISNIKEINNNQELNFDIEINSNTEEILENIQLMIEYPFGYKLLESNIKPVSNNNTWSFESINSLSSTTISLKGKFLGEINVDKNFRFIIGIEDPKTKEMLTVLSTQDNQVSIRKPFVITKLLIDGDSSENKSVQYDQDLRIDLSVTNTLPDSVTDVIVEVLLGGVLIDRRSVKTDNGFYDSNRDVIFWDKSTNSRLAVISPGETREMSFSIGTISSEENFIKTLRRATSELTVNVNAQRLGENRVPESIVASTKKQLRLKTEVLFISNLSYFGGAYSPEVNKETVFRYTGNISNTANTIKDVVFIAKLPPNSIWKNSYSSNIPSSSLKYNKSTREISISLGDIEAGVGIDKSIKEFYFDIGFTPTLTQTGQIPVTIIEPFITATDSFTGDKLLLKNNSMTTDITTGTNAEIDSRVK